MRKIIGLIICLTAFILSFIYYAKTTNDSINNLDSSTNIFHLKNGHTVVIKEIHANPIVTKDTWVKAGSGNENKENNGVSHFLEHLLFKGTKTRENGVIERILESRGARFNAATSKDYTHYYITIASDHFNKAIELHADMLQNPAIPPKELEKERKVVQEEIRRANDDPKRILLMNLFELMFKEHPYGLDTLGPHENIKTISREEIFEYFNEKYAPSNLITVITGDIETKQAFSLIKENFNSDKKPDKKKFSKIKREPKPEEVRNNIQKKNYKSGYLYMGFRGVPIEVIKENYALDLAGTILGGTKGSRLYQNIKEKQDLVSSISSFHYSLKNDSVFIISADFEPEKFDEVKKAILEELKIFIEQGITKEELKKAKMLAKRNHIYSKESVENIAQTIGYTMATTENIEHYKNHLKYIESINLEDVQEAVKKYLDPSGMALSVLLPKETEIKTVSMETNLPESKIVENSTKTKLNNGAVLITTQNLSNEIISMSVFFKGGNFLEPTPGTAALLSKNLLYGTKNRSYEELIKEIENYGIIINPDNAGDYFEITLKTTKDDFNRAFDILTDIIKNPAFEPKYLEKNKTDILSNIKKSRDNPLTVAVEEFVTTLYKDHPYGHRGSVIEENISQVTREEIIDYWSEIFIPENMIISAAGDVDHKELSRKLLNSFPASEKKAPSPDYSNKFSPLSDDITTMLNYDSQAAWMLLGWPVGNITDNKELATLRVIDNYLSGGLSSRLHRVFREENGLAYSVGSSYSPRMDRGHFILYIGTEPKNIEFVKKKFFEEIELLKTKPLTEEELEETKNKIIGRYLLSQETNQNKAYNIGKFQVIDKEFGFNYDFPDLINKVTAEDIINAADKYFSKPYVLSVVAPQQSGNELIP